MKATTNQQTNIVYTGIEILVSENGFYTFYLNGFTLLPSLKYYKEYLKFLFLIFLIFDIRVLYISQEERINYILFFFMYYVLLNNI